MASQEGGSGERPPGKRERPLKAVRLTQPDAPDRPSRQRPLKATRLTEPTEPTAPQPPRTAPTPPARERPLRAERLGTTPSFAQPPTAPPPRPRPQPTYAEPPPPPAPTDVVTVSFEGPGRQRRLTVAFRIILAIPALLWLLLLGLVANVVSVIGWFAALIIGRLPNGFGTFLARYVQYNARFYAYTQYLLTDRYPPFSLDAPDYAVSVEVQPTRLNRFAVLFRLILIVPAYIVYGVVAAGLQVAGVVIWLVVLIMGRVPTPLFEAEAAVLRYQVRFWGYFLLLTGTYPGGLFGDEPAPSDAQPPDFLPARPRITRLVLSRAGRRLVVVFIAVGVVFGAGSTAAAIVNAARTSGSLGKLEDRHALLATAVRRFQTDSQVCAVSGGIDCLHSAERQLADAYTVFYQQVSTIRFSPLYASAVQEIESDARDAADTLRRLAETTDPAQTRAGAEQYQRIAAEFDSDYQRVIVSY
jgi:hypothetical protein